MTVSRFPDAPRNITALPVDKRGFPVPHFVPWIDGEPDFQAVDPKTVSRTHLLSLCWICGRPLQGDNKTFVIGPMCAVTRTSSEPPSHLPCARFAATACPFLSKPMAKRAPRTGRHQPAPGKMIERNPGVTLLWTSPYYRTERQPEGGMLFRIGPPHALEWYAEGRTATRAEIMASIESGLPLLKEQATEPEAMALLERFTARALKLVP